MKLQKKGKIINIRNKVPYVIREVWKSLTFPAYGRLGIKVNIQSNLFRLLSEVFPDEKIVMDTSLIEKSKYVLSMCPDYICGAKAKELVEIIIDENSKLSQKEIKEKIKETFHIEKGKYPRWAQDSEWPFSETVKPMKYISQRNKNSEVIELIFEDVDTGKRVTIKDIYQLK